MPPMATSDLCEAIRQLAQDAANIYFPNGSTVSVTPDFARNDLIYVSVLFKSQRGATHNGRFMISRRDIEYSKDPQRLAAEIVRNIEQMQASLARGEPRLGDPFRDAVRRAIEPPKHSPPWWEPDLLEKCQASFRTKFPLDLMSVMPPPIPSSGASQFIVPNGA